MDKSKASPAPKADLTVDQIKAILGLPKVSLSDLERAAVRADVLVAEAIADRAKLTAARPGLLISSTDAEVADHDLVAAVFGRQQDRAAAIGAALRERIEVVREAEAEAERVARYEAAASLIPAPADIERDYKEMVRLGRSIVERFALASQAAAAVNADLPAGRVALPHPEVFRHRAGRPARVVSATRVQLYMQANGYPFADQREFKPRPNGMGWNGELVDADDRGYSEAKAEKLYPLKTFVDVLIEEGAAQIGPESFAYDLKIPPLRVGEPSGWSFDKDRDLDRVLDELSKLTQPQDAPAAPRPGRREERLRLDVFESRYGPIGDVGCKVVDGAAKPSASEDDFRGAVGIGQIRGGGEPGAGARATRL